MFRKIYLLKKLITTNKCHYFIVESDTPRYVTIFLKMKLNRVSMFYVVMDVLIPVTSQ